MNHIETQFNRDFAHWDIVLPPDDIINKRSGKICKRGWIIRYLFGSNQNGEYLDYYASHRMTNDRHVRIYANGESEQLPAISGSRASSQDPQKDKELEQEFYEKNRRVAEMLSQKGFL